MSRRLSCLSVSRDSRACRPNSSLPTAGGFAGGLHEPVVLPLIFHLKLMLKNNMKLNPHNTFDLVFCSFFVVNCLDLLIYIYSYEVNKLIQKINSFIYVTEN